MGCSKWFSRFAAIALCILASLLIGSSILRNSAAINQDMAQFAQWVTSLGSAIIVASVAVVVSILSLIVSIFNLANSRQGTKLNRQMYSDLQVERASRKLIISIADAFKDMSSDWPNDLWGVKLVLTNQSQVQPYFYSLNITLKLRRVHKDYSVRGILWRVTQGAEEVQIGYLYGTPRLPAGGASISVSAQEPYPILALNEFSGTRTFLINWETKQPIRLTTRMDRSQHRGPQPGAKEVWMLYSHLPADWRKRLVDSNYYLARVGCSFETDVGIVQVEGRFATWHTISGDFRNLLEETARQAIDAV